MKIRALFKILLLTALAAMSAFGFAGTLVLKSPTEGSFLGLSNNIQFSISGARVKVSVTAIVTGPGGTTQIPQEFTPDSDGKIEGSIPVNFSQGTPTGQYTIRLTATEPGNTYEDQTVAVQVDVQRPKFFSYSPYNNAFVRGVVQIRASILEENVKDWRVKINGQDIPNNTGSSNTLSVDWNAGLIERDGPNNIEIVVRDEANNEATLIIPVTLDRVKPTATITFPRTDTRFIPNTNVSVSVDITDASASSVDPTGVDVTIRRLDGGYLMRVPRISVTGQGNGLRWVGRFRYRPGLFPSQFKIVVTVVDRAGNVATPQEVTVRSR